MDTFFFYFVMGWEHLMSTQALDHQAFLAAMGACFLLKDWRPLLVLVTAFTLGHSLTLALSVLELVTLRSQWVEVMIPMTIAITALQQWQKTVTPTQRYGWLYASALCFGFIHGLGFANNIRFMLAAEQSLGVGLLGFNLGLEAAQLLFMAGLLALSQLVAQYAGVRQVYWTRTVAFVTFGISVLMIAQRISIL